MWYLERMKLGPSFSVATWNVNSLRARKERLISFLDRERPDVVCLQELKMQTDQFPQMDFLQMGYQAAWVGQKAYNGVAILSKKEHGPLTDIRENLGDEDLDPAARVIGATIESLGVRVMSVYVPNGQEVGSDKFDYKKKWLARLLSFLNKHHRKEEDLIIAGDFNVAPEDRDVYDPIGLKESVICRRDAREAFSQVLKFGLCDALRLHTQEDNMYTYWDYQQLAFPKNNGLRIDHVLVTETLSGACRKVWIDRNERKGTKPSDHVPLVAYFER